MPKYLIYLNWFQDGLKEVQLLKEQSSFAHGQSPL